MKTKNIDRNDRIYRTTWAYCYDKKGTLISEAKNNFKKSHPLQAFFAKKAGMEERIYLHAEIAAILKAGDRLIHRIEIVRKNLKGTLLCSKPCPVCVEAIKAFNIKHVTYTE